MDLEDIKKIDYNKIGLACGLELHQQLDTGKLFCKCKSKLIKDNTKPDRIIKRRLRAVYSEAGEFDKTALNEQKKAKTYVYYFYNSCNCLVEADCQPPIRTNPDALKIAVIISKLTNSQLVDKSIIMRKQVIDGSNVSGFQRTAMISTDGHLDFDFGKIRIDKILLEEDAARAIERKDTEVIYSLDRLGIPLIEMVVWHDMHTPKDTQKVALFLGQLFRTTGFVKRGLGSIRQDINVSIADGARIEIKGCQDLQMIPEIIDREILRQINLLELKEELKKRKIKEIRLSEINLTNIFKNTSSKAVKASLENKKEMYGFLISGFSGLLGKVVQPNRRVGTELSSILKAKTTLKGLFHADELPNYGITEAEINKVKAELKVTDKDSFILVMCDKKEISRVKEILEERLNQFIEGVPKETRIVNIEGNTEYQRPLSVGGARMYPETDLLPIVFTEELLTEAKEDMPLSVEERKKLYLEKFKISNQLAEKMVLDNYAVTFEKIIKANPELNPTQVAVFLLEDLTNLSRDGKIDLENVTNEGLLEFFSYKNFNKIPKSKLVEIYLKFNNSDYSLEDIIENLGVLKELDNIDVDKILSEIIEENKEKIIEQKERAKGLLMGRLMSKTRGLLNGKEASELIDKKLAAFLKKH
ncbi:MAG TPA: Glu-tRNA(Gln) amidotransferase subunit GatE [archaeon]|nr:Glu-tRNA(Gln) amidotransferase subunit GatE [archaeon]